MGWLRENWLDVLILVLSALVITEVALYLLGVHPLPFRSVPLPQEVSEAQEAVPSLPLPPLSGGDLFSSSQEEVIESGTEKEVPGGGEQVALVQGTKRQEEVVLPIPRGPAETTPSVPQAPAGMQKAPKAQSIKPRPSPLEELAKGAEIWRVAVGSFLDPENAFKLSEELSAKGFPVRLEAAGQYTRVVVGPYASEEEARRVARALAEYAPQVYRGEGPFSYAYFQVGAFKEGENALALVAKLREAGFFAVIRKDGLYRVLVGPVAQEKEEDVRKGLEELGLTPLAVR